MSTPIEQVLLRVYLRGADRTPHEPTSTRLVGEARRGLAGATVLRGILGLGRHGWERPSSWTLARHEPVIVEIVDTAAAIASFVRDVLPEVMNGGMATLERAAVVMYRHRRQADRAELSLASMVPSSFHIAAHRGGG